MTATRESLLAWVHACGVAALDAVFREQAEAVAGPKGRQQAGGTHHHWGTTPTERTPAGGAAASGGAGPVGVPSRGTSRSAVSRTLIRRTREQVATQLSRRLDGLDLVALFGDGVVVAGQAVIVLLGITREGRKEPLGGGGGSTENAALRTPRPP